MSWIRGSDERAVIVAGWRERDREAGPGDRIAALLKPLQRRGAPSARPVSSSPRSSTQPMRALLRPLAILLAAMLALASTFAAAQELFELEVEYVYGKNRKPRLGYRKPEVFDPLSDRLYQSGY